MWQNLQPHQSIERTKAIGFPRRPTWRGQRINPKPLRCRQLCRQGVIRHLVRLLTRTVDGYSADVLHDFIPPESERWN
jgi:hypothetical protein